MHLRTLPFSHRRYIGRYTYVRYTQGYREGGIYRVYIPYKQGEREAYTGCIYRVCEGSMLGREPSFLPVYEGIMLGIESPSPPFPVSLLGMLLSVAGLIEDYGRFFSSSLKVE